MLTCSDISGVMFNQTEFVTFCNIATRVVTYVHTYRIMPDSSPQLCWSHRLQQYPVVPVNSVHSPYTWMGRIKVSQLEFGANKKEAMLQHEIELCLRLH